MKNGLHIDEFGVKLWYLNNVLHREDGPAVVYDDDGKHWFINGKPHRLDGPAIERADGTVSWYMNDDYLGENSRGFWALWSRLTPEQQNNLNLHMWLAKYV